MDNKLLKLFLTLTRGMRLLIGRMRLRNRSVTLISNNCWAGKMYQYYHLEFNSPLVGLYIMSPDYIRVLENPELLTLPLEFIPQSESRWPQIIAHHGKVFPVARLGGADGPEVHFLHYPDEDTARAKWNRRVKRIDWDNAIVKFADTDGPDICTPDLVERFDRLPYREKVFFSSTPRPGIKSAVYLPGYKRSGCVKYCWKACGLFWSFADAANRLIRR